MITYILLGIGAAVAALAGYIAWRPGRFRITRRISIGAPAALAFEQVNDPHLWQEMSPYVKLDPDAKYTFAGPRAGLGAAVSWRGKKVGEGRMTIAELSGEERRTSALNHTGAVRTAFAHHNPVTKGAVEGDALSSPCLKLGNEGALPSSLASAATLH
ncbi:hypothetical protein BH20VER3_BH20VER3_12230 [soil metagenome]